MYRYSNLQKLKKTILFKFVVLSILDENVNTKSFTKKHLLDYLCLQYTCHFCQTETVMCMRT